MHGTDTRSFLARSTSPGLPRASGFTCLRVLLLIATLLAQSISTAACDLDELVSAGAPTGLSIAEIATADIDGSSVSADVCTQCGGLVTPSGCCAHGTAPSLEFPRVLTLGSFLLVPIASTFGFPQGSPSDLFRPPIPA
jgi:hypothetical protein